MTKRNDIPDWFKEQQACLSDPSNLEADWADHCAMQSSQQNKRQQHRADVSAEWLEHLASQISQLTVQAEDAKQFDLAKQCSALYWRIDNAVRGSGYLDVKQMDEWRKLPNANERRP